MTRYVKFNRLLCSNDKMYDDEVCADRFRYQLATFEFRVSMGLSPSLPAHNAYEIAIGQIIEEIYRMSHCLA